MINYVKVEVSGYSLDTNFSAPNKINPADIDTDDSVSCIILPKYCCIGIDPDIN